MAKGQESKQILIKQILESYEGSFLYNDGKEIRIPMEENGEELQIKITLTCAKTNVEPGSDNALPGEKKKTPAPAAVADFKFEEETIAEPSEDELNTMNDLMKALDL